MQEKPDYYQHLKKFSYSHTHFAFLDTEDYLADGLFIKNQVRVYFGDEFVTPDSPYHIISARILEEVPYVGCHYYFALLAYGTGRTFERAK